jgi:two-component system, cell cycle sensor histidine kinase and response regulator CckA
MESAAFRITEAAHAAATLHDLFEAIHGIVDELMPARNFYIALVDDGGKIAFPYFVDEHDPAPEPKLPGNGLTEYVLRTGRPVLVTPEVAAELERRGDVALIGSPSIDWLGVPLTTGGRTVGVLAVQSYAEGTRYTDRDLQLLGYVSAHIAMAVERKRSDEALQRSEERYRTLVDGVQDVIFATDSGGRLTALNHAFDVITGWSRAEWLGRPFDGLLHPEDLATARRLLRSVVDRAAPVPCELRIRTHGGDYLVGEVRARAQLQGETVVGLLGIVRDITERRALEAQLRQAQKMEAVGQVAGGVAHDFNNLLTAVLSSADLLRTAVPADSPLLEDVETIADAATRGAELTRKLLSFSRHQPLQLGPVALGTAAADFIRLARRVVPESVRIVLRVEDDNATVRADPLALEQMLMNLVTNARDAMPGGGTILIEVGHRSLDETHLRAEGWGAPGEYVVLGVTDTGCGMDAETQAHIFEPFFTTKPADRGTGLGMPMVYGLVKEHGGFVHVYSEPGHGTVMRLYFPAVTGAGDPVAREPAAEVRGGTETILLVEDGEAVRRVAKRILEQHGYTVIGAADGREALAILLSGGTRVDLVVSDVVMPRKGGAALVDAMFEAGVMTRVLLTSGYSGREMLEEVRLDPAIPFLAKPWRIADLLRKVREALDDEAGPFAR